MSGMNAISWCTLVISFVLVSSAHAAIVVIDPNDFSEDEVLTDVGLGAVITAAPPNIAIAFGFTFPPAVIGRSNPLGSAGCCWETDELLRVDFDQPTDIVEVAFLSGFPSNSGEDWSGFGLIHAFDESDSLQESASTILLDEFIVFADSAVVMRPQRDIDHILIAEDTLTGHPGIQVAWIAFNAPEPSALLLLAVGTAAFYVRSRRRPVS